LSFLYLKEPTLFLRSKPRIYLKRTGGGHPDDGLFYESILVRGGSNLNPDDSPNEAYNTQSHSNSASNGSVSSADITLGDFNIDGFVDLYINGLDNAPSNASNWLTAPNPATILATKKNRRFTFRSKSMILNLFILR